MRTKTLVTLAMLSALAYLSMLFLRVPIMPALPFIKFDPKDVVIVIGGFLYGPLPALAITVVVAFVEMITVSESGWIGLLMNIISSASFACTAAIIYKNKRRLSGAVIGLAAGCIAMTSVMLLWNYVITPLYMHVPREVVAGMLLTGFLPFNLIKSILNAAIAMLLYKPVSTALRKARLHTESASVATRGKFSIGIAVVSAFIIISVTLVILTLQGRI